MTHHSSRGSCWACPLLGQPFHDTCEKHASHRSFERHDGCLDCKHSIFFFYSCDTLCRNNHISEGRSYRASFPFTFHSLFSIRFGRVFLASTSRVFSFISPSSSACTLGHSSKEEVNSCRKARRPHLTS